jgi:DNA repair protein RecO (recombination protein O)
MPGQAGGARPAETAKMEWSDEGIVLAARALGETSVVLSLLTRDYGRHSGLVRGGIGRRTRGLLQPGNRISARWRARLADHLGTLSCEPGQSLAPEVLADRSRLAGIAAACAVTETALPEREPVPAIYQSMAELFAAIESDSAWRAHYVRWEIELLAELGFGLDLASCALTGATNDLIYVSPRSGRAVSAIAGAPWQDRLLRLPTFLVDACAEDDQAIVDGLALTGHFLLRHVYAEQGRALPPARARLAEQIGRGRHGKAGALGSCQ